MKAMPIEKKEKDLLVNLMEYVYVEMCYVRNMKDANL